jgi:7-carboxy-7-deazaguanine synthase (Cx14CxxC type)
LAYSVKEIFKTLQGEGALAGRVAVFCRFAGCNLWSGREEDRDTAVCRFCDTDFVGVEGTAGGKYREAAQLVSAIATEWGAGRERRFVVLTGGEPLLQVDQALIAELHQAGFEIAVETNGTVDPPAGLDWICVSPKSNAALKVMTGHELKLVYPQADALPEAFARLDFKHFSLQPMDGPARAANTASAIAYCLEHPQWSLSVQTHKQVGIR